MKEIEGSIQNYFLIIEFFYKIMEEDLIIYQDLKMLVLCLMTL